MPHEMQKKITRFSISNEKTPLLLICKLWAARSGEIRGGFKINGFQINGI